MNKDIQKPFRWIYAAGMLVLAAALLIVSFLPIVSLRSTGEPSEWYTGGRYTSVMGENDEDLPLTFGTALFAVQNFSDIYTILQIQGYESSIEELEDSIAEERAKGEDASESRLEKLNTELTETGLKLTEALASQTEEQKAALDEKLKSGELTPLFRCTESALQAFVGTTSEGNATFGIISGMVGLLALVAYILFVVIFPIVAAISLLVLLIRFLTRMKNLEDEQLAKLSAVKLYAGFVPLFLMLLVLLSVGSFHVFLNGGLVALLLVLLALAVALNIAREWILEGKSGVASIIRQGLTVLSLVALTVMAFGLSGMRLSETFIADSGRFSLEYQTAMVASGSNLTTAGSQADSKCMLAAAMVVGIGLIAATLIGIGLHSLLTGRSATTKFARKKSGTPKFILAGLLLVLMIAVPVLLVTGSVESRSSAARSGSFKVILDAYRVEGTADYTEYQAAQVALDAATATGSAELIDQAQATLDGLETNQKASLTLSVAFAVILFASEICYAVLPGKFETNDAVSPEEKPLENPAS